MDINHKTTAGTVPHFSSLNEKKKIKKNYSDIMLLGENETTVGRQVDIRKGLPKIMF